MAGSKSIGSIFASLSIRDVNFQKGLKKAGDGLAKFGAASLKMGGVAAAAIGAGLLAGSKHAITMGGELTDLSAQTGVAISDLMKIQQAYKDNGKEASSAGKDINKMQKAIFAASKDVGGKSDPFAELGLSAEKLMDMNPTEQFFTIANAIKAIENPAEQTAMAMKVFGKSGGELLGVFKGSSLDDVNRTLGAMPALMERVAGKFDQVDDILGRLPNKSNQFFTGFTAGIIDQVIPAMEKIDGYDFTNLGESIGAALGDNINAAINLFGSDEPWTAFILEAELAFAKILELPVFRQIAELFDFAYMSGGGAAVGEVAMNALSGKYAGFSAISEGMNDLALAFEKMKETARNAGPEGYVKDMESKIDAYHQSIADEAQARIDAAKAQSDYEKARNEVYKNSPDYVDPMTALPETITPQVEVKMPEMQGQQIDEYQKRGLSLSKTPGALQDKLLKVQEQIRDILNGAKIQGKELVWQ